MTQPQALTFTLLAGAMICFAWGRFRYDLIALTTLLVGVICGLVPAQRAFEGFTSDVVIIIASALVISAAVTRSGVVEQLLRPALTRLRSPQTQVPALASATAVLSMMTKNVGALAVLMPLAIRLARTTGVSQSSLLMPMSFLSLLGGLTTLVGTSTNIIVSQVREEALGRPFRMFDFAPVGLILTALGLLFVSFGWRLLPQGRRPQASLDEALAAPYATEAKLPAQLPQGLNSLRDLDLASDGIKVLALLRNGERIASPTRRRKLLPGDTLLLQGEHDQLRLIFNRTPLLHVSAEDKPSKEQAKEEVRSIEAVVQVGSQLVGRTADQMRFQEQLGVNLMGISRSGAQIAGSLGGERLRAGDVLVLQAGERALPSALLALGALPLVEREVRLEGASKRPAALIILVAAMLAAGLQLTPVAVAFFGAALAMVMSGAISMREAYASLDAPVLVLIGALTPLSEAVRSSGGADLIAHALAPLLQGWPAAATLAALMVLAMAASPFLHNAPTVLILGPIAVAVASRLHVSPDGFLMAVATGAGCDFLTPVGHQCNTLVMGPGGYRFGDYARLGLPLSLMVLIVGPLVIAWIWPLTRA
ncbi:SLC13 family permease [Phenylobacterium montanum]|uniref:Anion permease n=1 Tax=Phenylobacterium montanum TaxID=2823693 RepID=A0A975G2F3_9CAUL|nr:SLC13 family permease [Caulobacter sp. S6]QUD89262.1 anion permease [Caulobacter sp. S6]